MDISALKLMPPSTALPLMVREQVLQRLTDDGMFRIILLRAPAGYGKTSVLRMIYTDASHKHQPAWLTLDSNDNDPARLLLGLRAALQVPTIADADDYAQLSQSGVTHLFLDDVERLDTTALQLLFYLVTQVFPQQLRVFIGTRTLHDVSVGSLKAKGTLRELDIQDLQFTREETVAYLRQTRLDLHSDNLNLLQHASEGWPAAVELIALAWRRLQGRTNVTIPSLHNLHDLGEYLVQEVFEAQPDNIKAFLIATVPLASFNTELADIARSASDSSLLITAIRTAGLPIQPLHSAWFRYHPLFAEHVALRHPPAPALYIRVAEWLTARGRDLEAFDCFIKGERMERAADVLESIMMPLRTRGQIATVVQMSDRLPLCTVQTRPALAATVITGLIYTGRQRDLGYWLDLFREQSRLPNAAPHYGEALRALDPLHAFLTGQLKLATELATQNWPLQENANLLDRANSVYLCVYSHLSRGELEEAAALMIIARRDCGLSKSVIGMGVICFLQAYLDAIQGDLCAAEQQLATLDRMGIQDSEVISPLMLYFFSAGLLLQLKYERNELDAVSERLQMANGIILIGLPWESHASILLIQARMIRIEQDASAARQWLEAQIMGAGRPLPEAARRVLEGELSRLASQLDLPGIAAGYIRLLGDGQGLEHNLVPCLEIDGGGIAQARLLIYTGQPQLAVERLGQLLEHALHYHRLWRAAKLRVLLAIALDRCGQTREAEASLTAAIEQAAQSGLTRCLLDEGEAALVLLRRLQSRARHMLSAGAARHLDALLSVQDARPPLSAPTPDLTQTESAMLTMVAHGKTNKEIGDALFLSVNTVKWYMSQIFRKLNVSNRSQAVFSARQSGLLPKQ